MKTMFAKTEETQRGWHLVDADGKTLGRMCSRVAQVLRGKHKPFFTPHADTGDFVVVINAEKVRVTGDKERAKIYFTHSGYPAGHRLLTLRKIRERRPEKIIELAVRGMLPKGRLGRKIFKKLKVYSGKIHPHSAQKPKLLEV